MKFPKRIYVVMQDDNGDHILIADDDIAGLDGHDGEKVGIYELVGEKTVKVDVTAE